MTFYELEKKCKQRRFKNFLYKLLFFLSIICIILLIVYLYEVLSKNVNDIHKNNIKKELKQKKIIQKHFAKKEITKNKIIKKQPIKENSEALLIPVIPNIELKEKEEVNKSKTFLKKQIMKKKKVKKIFKNKVKNNIEKDIIKIEKIPSYKESITLAKKYLNEKKYDLALKWAKNANMQNKISPDSWIISAKALFYSGKKKKAIEILKVYLQYYKNKKVENLMKEFENEKNN